VEALRASGLIALGAALGANARYWLGVWFEQRLSGFPWGTFTVNLSGCLAIGFVLGLTENSELGDTTRWLAVTGFLGGYTTFSAFSAETIALLQQGYAGRAAGYVAGSVFGGVAACALGWLLGGAVASLRAP